MSHKDDINVLSGRLHRIIGMLCDLEDDLGIIYDELSVQEQTCEVETDNINGDLWWWHRCRSCKSEWEDTDYKPNYCPNCGAKVVKK